MQSIYRRYALKAKKIRDRYHLTKQEAAWCVIWLAGAKENDIPALVDEMDHLRRAKSERIKGKGELS